MVTPRKKNPAEASPPDPWKEKLQQVLKKERPSSRRLGLWLGLALLAALGFLVWLIYPKPSLPLPPLVAFDALVRHGDEAHLRALLDMQEVKSQPRLSGREMIFQESRMPLPGHALLLTKSKLIDNKWGRAVFEFPAEFRQGAFEAHLPGIDRQEGVKDQAHVFVRPAASRLLVVSVEGTLTLASAEDWSSKNARDIVPVPDAAAALNAARKSGLEPVYLSLETDRPAIYQKMRGWVRSRFGPSPSSLPEGPTLGRFDYPSEKNAAYREVLKDLQERFTGELAVTADFDIAQRFKDAGWTVHLIGGGEAPPGVEHLRNWQEWERRIAPKK